MLCPTMKTGLLQQMDDQEYLPLSWLSQRWYCPRRAALLLNERLWVENADTAKGRAEHERVHTERVEKRGDTVKLYEYTVYSDRLSLIGKCDCIEAVRSEKGCLIPAATFPVELYPIEYKHGIVREEEEYKIQLCAQAICLEEMFGTSIAEGALYFISSHKRMPVVLDAELRNQTEALAETLHCIRSTLSVPTAEYSAKCRRCSLAEVCMPKVKSSASTYLQKLYREAGGAIVEEDGKE